MVVDTITGWPPIEPLAGGVGNDASTFPDRAARLGGLPGGGRAERSGAACTDPIDDPWLTPDEQKARLRDRLGGAR